ncbi:hypothetical protein Tco_1467840 [Tanacetum coccineum]
MTYPEEVEETIGIPMEGRTLDHIKLEDLGLITFSQDIFLKSREIPSVDELELQRLPNFSPSDELPTVANEERYLHKKRGLSYSDIEQQKA